MDILVYGKYILVIGAHILPSHDSFPVKWIAFNANAFMEVFQEILSIYNGKMEVLLCFKYLKITKRFSCDLSSCKEGYGEKH